MNNFVLIGTVTLDWIFWFTYHASVRIAEQWKKMQTGFLSDETKLEDTFQDCTQRAPTVTGHQSRESD